MDACIHGYFPFKTYNTHGGNRLCLYVAGLVPSPSLTTKKLTKAYQTDILDTEIECGKKIGVKEWT